jgi:lysyl-tRNA synthetase class 2
MDYSNESRDRQEKIRKLKEAGVIVYANNFEGKQDISHIRRQESMAKNIDTLMESGATGEYKTAGRIITFKSHGKLAFAKLRDHTGDIQICFVKDKLTFNTGKELVSQLTIEGEEKDAYKIAEKFIHIGDYIGVK